MAETPAGHRLAIQVTVLLHAESTKQAAAISNLAASMSSSGLVIASPSARM